VNCLRMEVGTLLLWTTVFAASDKVVIRLQRARSMAAATSSLNSSALCDAPLILTISISRAAICPAGSL
jgi:hypothetical protein